MQRRRKIDRKTPALWCVLSGGCGLALLGIVFLVFLRSPSTGSDPVSNIAPSTPAQERNGSDSVLDIALNTVPALPPLDFPTGSVEEACGLNEFPPYDYNIRELGRPSNSPYSAELGWIPLQSEACRLALETHLNSINPYLWGVEDVHENQEFAFVVLEDPLTFERIFADPVGDLSRVQDALTRPECLLDPSETNWELKETCHAEAFLNYALINRFCYKPPRVDAPQLPAPERDGLGKYRFTTWESYKQYRAQKGISKRSRPYISSLNPTPEQDRSMWKHKLEDAWVEMKCEELSPHLEFTPEQYPILYERVMAFQEPKARFNDKNVREYLIELGARLGDAAAGLTIPLDDGEILGYRYREEGSKFGRFADIWKSTAWSKLSSKKEPTVDRFLQSFQLLARLDARRADPRDEMEFDWEWVARHLCEPPYFTFRGRKRVFPENTEHQSCQEVVHEIRQSGTTFRPLLDVLEKFEQVALELEVYE